MQICNNVSTGTVLLESCMGHVNKVSALVIYAPVTAVLSGACCQACCDFRTSLQIFPYVQAVCKVDP